MLLEALTLIVSGVGPVWERPTDIQIGPGCLEDTMLAGTGSEVEDKQYMSCFGEEKWQLLGEMWMQMTHWSSSGSDRSHLALLATLALETNKTPGEILIKVSVASGSSCSSSETKPIKIQRPNWCLAGSLMCFYKLIVSTIKWFYCNTMDVFQVALDSLVSLETPSVRQHLDHLWRPGDKRLF